MFNGFELTWKENQIGVLPSLIAWDEVVMVWHLNKIGTGCKHVCVNMHCDVEIQQKKHAILLTPIHQKQSRYLLIEFLKKIK